MRTIYKTLPPAILQKEQQKAPPATRRDAENRWKRFRGTRGKNEEIEQEIDRLLDDPEALRLLAECELCDTGGKLRQFHTAATARFGRIGQQVMDEICPACSAAAK
ncbi:MAG: hypothetical protein U9P10_10100 [Thermodesulfobacteriota bacterium]|nr:hypothetical protein [Thermodesulfobacteriota bacterium]